MHPGSSFESRVGQLRDEGVVAATQKYNES